MNQVQNVLKLSNSQADTLKFYKNLVNFMGKTPAKQKNQPKKEERRKNKFERITKQPLDYYVLKVLLFRENNNRDGTSDFERNGNKFWLVGNYREGQAKRDYIDVEVFGPNPFPKELLKKYIVEYDDIRSWNQIMEILLTNDEFSEFISKTWEMLVQYTLNLLNKYQKQTKNTK